MNDLQLFINDQLVDLSDDSPIALSFQINNLADVQNQQGNTSNQFKLPLTQRNRQLLGFPDEPALTTIAPYRKYPAKFVQDGLEIIPNAIAELSSIEKDGANITVLSGNVDFFDAIDGKIYDMGDSTSRWTNYGKNMVWKSYDHQWTLDNVAGSQNKTDGWIWPVVDYGFFDPVDFTKSIDIRNQRPGFFIKTAIELLLQSAGYKGGGSLLNDPLYPLLICQFANGSFDHGTDWQNAPDNRGINVSQSSPVTINHPNALNPTFNANWNTINSDPSRQFNGGQFFTSKDINDVIITVEFPHVKFHGRVTPNTDPSKLLAKIMIQTPGNPDFVGSSYTFGFDGHGEKDNFPDTDPNGWTRISGSGSNIVGEIDIKSATVSYQTTLPANGGVYVQFEFQGLSGSWAMIDSGAIFSITSQQQTVQPGQMIQCERILPDISQKDFLKDTLQRFGVVCQTDNTTQTISFNSFHDIVNNIPIAKNWTSKCVDQGKQVYFQLGNYSQINYMQYKADANILPAKYGWSQINIDDQTLPATGTLFESQFGASLTQPYYGGTVAQIKMHDSSQTDNSFSIGVAPRILIDQKFNLQTINKTVTFTDGTNNYPVNGIISTPYFAKSDAPVLSPQYGQASLLYNDLRKRYYPELEKILTQAKKVIRYLLLNPRDILELNLLIPVFLEQEGAYFYINKIDSWRKGQPCKVELVKLG